MPTHEGSLVIGVVVVGDCGDGLDAVCSWTVLQDANAVVYGFWLYEGRCGLKKGDGVKSFGIKLHGVDDWGIVRA